ncbi:hypothetical protein BDR26DRAFT_1007248 [Obelidium mucronatum]|nr:hypothetical protein BDR26DRAFT_1007248 [Obelidium mucronatum]
MFRTASKRGSIDNLASSSDIASFSIELDDNNGTSFFEPSQGIQGRAILVLLKPTAIASVQVQVQGLVSGGLSYTLIGAQKSATLPQPLPLSCHRHLFLDTITLFPSASQPLAPGQKLPAGRHTWPFSFRVPPVSILPPTYRGKMGSVRYEAVVSLERHSSAGGLISLDTKKKRFVARREIPVRSVETRQGRRALETPVFKNVQLVGSGNRIVTPGEQAGNHRRDGVVLPEIDLAVKMPRAGFIFDEQIPFTIDILNTSSTTTSGGCAGVWITDIAIEERVTVIYMDRSTWGPLTTTRVPFPFKEYIPASPYNESRSFRLGLPRLEPDTPHPHPPPPPIPGSNTRRQRAASLSRSTASSSITTAAAAPESRIGLNASFQTQPLKVTHHITFKIRPIANTNLLQRRRRPIVIDIPIVLIPSRRESSLLYQSETLAALVEEVERDEEERERRREGRVRRLSVETLPVYERGEEGEDGVIVLECVGGGGVEVQRRGAIEGGGGGGMGGGGSVWATTRNTEEIAVNTVDTQSIEIASPPPEYNVYGFDESTESLYSRMGHVRARSSSAADSDSFREEEAVEAEPYLNDEIDIDQVFGRWGGLGGGGDPFATATATTTATMGSQTTAASSGVSLHMALASSSSSSVRSTITQSYRPPGEDVIALSPFVDNNPPSFQESTCSGSGGGVGGGEFGVQDAAARPRSAVIRRASFSSRRAGSILQRTLGRSVSANDVCAGYEERVAAVATAAPATEPALRRRVSQFFGVGSVPLTDAVSPPPPPLRPPASENLIPPPPLDTVSCAEYQTEGCQVGAPEGDEITVVRPRPQIDSLVEQQQQQQQQEQQRQQKSGLNTLRIMEPLLHGLFRRRSGGAGGHDGDGNGLPEAVHPVMTRPLPNSGLRPLENTATGNRKWGAATLGFIGLLFVGGGAGGRRGSTGSETGAAAVR